MNTPRNTDEIVPDSTIPRPDQEEMPIQLIDIHLYKFSEEEIKSVESTLEVPEEPPQSEEWLEQTESLKQQPQRNKSLLFLGFTAFFVLMMIGGSLAYAFLFTPTATITIIPKSLQVQTTGNITVVTGTADITKNQIAGRILPSITMSQAQTTATTGETHQDATGAHGTVTFYNVALSPQTVVAGTLITGSDGIQVVTDQDAVIPAGTFATNGQVTVAAHTVATGPASNIAAHDISGPCCRENVLVENGNAFAGGQKAEIYQSVSKQDIDLAAADLQTSLIQAVTAALSTRLQSSETLITPPECSPSMSADHEVGDRATQVQVTVSESCTGRAYETQSFQQVLRQAQAQTVGKQQRENYRLEGLVQARIQTATAGSRANSYTLTVQSRGVWVYQFSKAELGRLAASIAGKKTRQATPLLLQASGVQQVQLSNAEETLPTDPQNIHFLLVVQQ